MQQLGESCAEHDHELDLSLIHTGHQSWLHALKMAESQLDGTITALKKRSHDEHQHLLKVLRDNDLI